MRDLYVRKDLNRIPLYASKTQNEYLESGHCHTPVASQRLVCSNTHSHSSCLHPYFHMNVDDLQQKYGNM